MDNVESLSDHTASEKVKYAVFNEERVVVEHMGQHKDDLQGFLVESGSVIDDVRLTEAELSEAVRQVDAQERAYSFSDDEATKLRREYRVGAKGWSD